MPHIFISYSKQDRNYARQLADHLLSLGFDVWIDDRIDFGEDWELAIFDAIDQCAAFIVVMTPDSYASKWVRRECHHAEKRKKSEFPILLKGEEFPRYGLNQYVDVRSGILPPDDFYNRLAKSAPRKSAPGLNVSEIPPVAKSQFDQQIIALSAAPQPADAVRDAIERAYNFRNLSSRKRPWTTGELVTASVARAFTDWHNRDWQPFVTTFPDSKIPDMPFCLLPVGMFKMGSDDLDGAKPAHLQIIEKPYWIAQYPVTNAQWKRAVEEKIVREPPYGLYGHELYKNPEMENAAVVHVDWLSVRKFARWLGCRLPTEREWEYAARGVESWPYLWGPNWNQEAALSCRNNDGTPKIIEANDEIPSWVDARYLFGNVMEWTNSLYQNYPYTADQESDTEFGIGTWPVLRGGDWYNNYTKNLHTASRSRTEADQRMQNLGFRLARSIE